MLSMLRSGKIARCGNPAADQRRALSCNQVIERFARATDTERLTIPPVDASRIQLCSPDTNTHTHCVRARETDAKRR